jgi:hypothetical protein
VVHTEESAGPEWKKSSRSAANGHCVEVAQLSADTIGVRNSRDAAPDRPVLKFTHRAWREFLSGVITSEFDHPE